MSSPKFFLTTRVKNKWSCSNIIRKHTIVYRSLPKKFAINCDEGTTVVDNSIRTLACYESDLFRSSIFYALRKGSFSFSLGAFSLIKMRPHLLYSWPCFKEFMNNRLLSSS